MAVILTLAVAVACSDDADETVTVPPTLSPPSADDIAYLDAIRGIDEQIGSIVNEIDEALNASWPTRGRLFAVLDEAELATTFVTMLEQASALEPPDGYNADHQLYLASLSESAELAEEMQAAIDEEDLVNFRLRITDLFLSRANLLLRASLTFCSGVLQQSQPPHCLPPVPAPAGEYGAALRDIGRRYQTEFNARVGSFPPAMTAEERNTALGVLQPAIISALEQAGDEVSALDPPDEFRADHEVILRYFTDTLDVSRAISQAAEDADQEALDAQFGRSGSVLCEAARAFSDEAREITSILDAPDCG